MNSKNLHKHSLPVISLAIAALFALAGLTLGQSTSYFTAANLGNGLTHQAVRVKSTSLVSAQFQLNPTNPESSLPDLQGLNQALELSLITGAKTRST